MTSEQSSVLGAPLLDLDARGLLAWLGASLDALGEARTAIDSLNVFPIADGDTGTNMYLTLESCWEAAMAVGSSASISELTDAVSHAAIMGARGNSGVIMAEAMRGICGVLASVDAGPQQRAVVDPSLIAAALRAASDRARAAVAHPVEGTIITVAEAAATAAEELLEVQASRREPLVRHLLSVSERMHGALARTKEQLPVLAAADVVDAGAQGLVVIYDALLDSITGVRRRREPVAGRAMGRTSSEQESQQGSSAAVAAGETTTGAFEVMFVCEANADAVAAVREALDDLGDSLVVSGGPDLWSFHVHVDDPGAAVEAAYARVVARNVRISYLPGQRDTAEVKELLEPGRGLVAQAHGPGVSSLLESIGVTVLTGRPDRRPSTADILMAIDECAAAEVIVLPSDSDTIPVAEVAADRAREHGRRVTVIPTRSIVQTLAAVAVHDPEGRFDDDVVAMADAARATRYGAITIASREALTSAGRCQTGDVLGVVEGDIVEIGIDPGEVAEAVLRRLLSTGGEMVTLIQGESAPTGVLAQLQDMILDESPGVDVTVIDGGQQLWPLILGVE